MEKIVRNWGGYTQPGFLGRAPVFMANQGSLPCLESSTDFVEMLSVYDSVKTNGVLGSTTAVNQLYASTAPPMEVMLPFSTQSLLLTVVSSRYHPIFNLCEKQPDTIKRVTINCVFLTKKEACLKIEFHK